MGIEFILNDEKVSYTGNPSLRLLDVLREHYKLTSVKCGFCTPGMVMATEALLSVNPHPTEEAVRVALSGNLCRCTGYNAIVKAVMRAAEKGEGLW